MKKKLRFLTRFSTAAILSLTLISGSVFAQDFNDPTPVLPGEIPIEAGPAPQNAVTQTFSEVDYVKTQILDDRAKVQEFVTSNMEDIYGGVYTDEDGYNVILLTDTSLANEEKIKSIAKFKDKTKIQKVKYSKEKLYSSKEALSALAIELGLEGVGISVEKNKVNVYITEESYKINKETILKHIDEDMVNWVIGDLVVKKKAYNLYPGEQVERTVTGGEYQCSLGFNGRANGNDVGVIAGHCGNGTWYDKSDGTAAIGNMSNGSLLGNFDAGYIRYTTNVTVTPSVFLNGNSMTIGTTDYAGYYREVGDYVRVHARSGNGSSFGPVQVIDNSFDIPGDTQDVVVTTLSGAIGGDSGGLVYSIANNGTKNYARIEGVYAGSLLDQNGNEVYDYFSKYSRVFDGLGMSGVYTDSSF